MKQYLVMIGLLICLSLGAAPVIADSTPTRSTWMQTLEKLAPSVFKLEIMDCVLSQKPPFESSSLLGHGTGFVIKQTATETIMMTCRHVAKVPPQYLQGRVKMRVEVNGNTYISGIIQSANNMDCAIITYSPAIPGCKALEFDTSPSTAVTEVISAGFGGRVHLKGQKQRFTLSHGFVSRNVLGSIAFGQNNILVENLIYGTATLIGGYSGGPLLNTDLKIIGINVAISSLTNMFTDGRAAYNFAAWYLKAKTVKVPVDNTFDVFNREGYKRLSINKATDTFESQYGKRTLRYLELLMQAEVGPEAKKSYAKLAEKLYQWIGYESLITINGKHYTLRAASMLANSRAPLSYENKYSKYNKGLYIYMCGEGWGLVLHLAPITEDGLIDALRETHQGQKKARLKKEEADKAKKEVAETTK